MRLKNNHGQRGFTLTELVIAMALFSFILLFAVMAFIQINKIYVKGITLKRMNDQARTIISDMTRDIAQEKSPDFSSRTGALCLPNLGVSYKWSQTPGDFERGNGTICPTGDLSNSQQLIDSNTSVQYLKIQSVDNMTGVISVDLVLSTQNSDQLNNPGTPDVTCKGSIGDQYCGVVSLSTVVRLSN